MRTDEKPCEREADPSARFNSPTSADISLSCVLSRPSFLLFSAVGIPVIDEADADASTSIYVLLNFLYTGH